MDKKISYYNVYKAIFFITFGYISIIDTLNGIIIHNFGISISILYRTIILLIFMFYIIQNNSKRKVLLIILFAIYMLFIGLFNIYINESYQGIFNEISQLSKFLFIIISIESFNNVIKNQEERKDIIDKIIKTNIILFPLCVIIPYILNIGLDVYSGSIGHKGFFNSNNELAIVLSCIYIFSISKLYKETNIKNIIQLFMVLFSIVLVASKVGFSIILVITLIYIAKALYDIKGKLKFWILFILGLTISAFLLGNEIVSVIEGFMIRQQSLYTQSKNSLIYTLLAGRNEFLNLIYNYTIELDGGYIKFILGYGIHVKEMILGTLLNTPGALKTIEMDFFDVLFSYGIIGVLLIYGYFMNKLIKNRNRGLDYKLSYGVLFIIGAVSGHVLWNAMAGSILVILSCGLDINYKNG